MNPSTKKESLRKHLRKAFFLFLILGSFVLFGRSILLKATGGMTTAYLKVFNDLDFTYSKVDWENGALHFDEIAIEKSEFSLTAPTLSVSFRTNEIVMAHPLLEIHSFDPEVTPASLAIESRNPFKRALDILGSPYPSDFALKIEEGSLVIGNNDAQLKMEASKANVLISLSDGVANLILNRKGETEIALTSHLFPMSFFSSNLGIVDGEILLQKQEENWLVLKSNLRMEEVTVQNIVENFTGELTYIGPLYGEDLIGTIESSKLRLKVDEGKTSFLQQLNGVLSFDGRSGVQWECTFINQDQEMGSSGKGFFYSLEGRWIESTLFSNQSSAALHLREKEECYELNIAADSVQKGLLSWIKDAMTYFEIPTFGWDFEKGEINGEGSLCFLKSGGLSWEIKSCQVDDLKFKIGELVASFEKGVVKEGAYGFTGGGFSFGDQVSGKNWSGKGDISNVLGSVSGEMGSLSIDANYRGNVDLLFASLKVGGAFNGEMSCEGSLQENGINFAIRDGSGTLLSGYTIENLRLNGEATQEGVTLSDVKGIFDAGKKVSFYAPIFQSEGIFDLRFEKPFFDLARFVGNATGGTFTLDKTRSHIFGRELLEGSCSLGVEGLNSLELACDIPWKVFPNFFEVPPFFSSLSEEDFIYCNLSFSNDIYLNLASKISTKGSVFDVDLNVLKTNGKWSLEPSIIWNWDVEGDFTFEKEAIQITRGKGKSSDGMSADFSGRVVSLDQWDLALSHLFVDLTELEETKKLGVEGILEGEGMIYWKGGLESDFDFHASGLKYKGIDIESETHLNFSGSNKKGLLIRGLNLATNYREESARFRVGLFQYVPSTSQLVFRDTKFDLSSHFLSKFDLDQKAPTCFGDFFDQPLRGIADIMLNADLSNIDMSMQRADILFEKTPYTLQRLHFELKETDCHLGFDLVHPDRIIPFDLAFSTDPVTEGRLTIENGLKIDWSYTDTLNLNAIEGRCSGIEASFQKETDSLIGRAHINGAELKAFLPSKIAKVFEELKIGDGYELMGRLAIKERDLLFRGLLSGKQIDLFGFEFKNIMGRIEWDANHLLISDLKVSDFAGVLKIDQILAEQVGDHPWTLSIPHITVTELRPSLLQSTRGPPGEISPLVVRHLRIDNLKGIVEDRSSYTASGELFFINSYKRGTSLLELPSDFLSRIIGLDLDLLVPVCGTLKYELNNGFFTFTELEGSYSENKRSEFFLSLDESEPTMDLDWNLSIFIEMKQFVLFKFTEAFKISVKGKLDDPKINLQRKKRFFGVL